MKVAVSSNKPKFSYKFNCNDTGIVGVYGISGCGKSSLLNALAGFNTNITGLIEFNDEKVLDTDNNIKPHVLKCSYMQQHPMLFEHWTIAENLAFAQKYCAQAHDLDFLLTELKCKHLVNNYPNELSGGEKQRVAFIRALIQIEDGCLVLLDEPFSALDYKLRKKALKLLSKQNNCLVFLVTHEIKELYELADSLLMIKESEISYNEMIVTAMSDGFAHLPVAAKMWFNDESHVIYADDVSISLKKHNDSSLIHQLEVTIDEIKAIEDFIILRLNYSKTVSVQKLYAKIKAESFNRLCLKQNQQVYANFKASSYTG